MRGKRRRSPANWSAKSSEPPSFLLGEVLPELADWLRHDCKRMRHHDLADRINDLRIYGRCDCGRPCGTFYCAPPLQRAGQASEDMVIWTAQGRITEIQTLDPNVDAMLRGLFRTRYDEERSTHGTA